MKILVLNAGSSSLKYKLYDLAQMSTFASGMIEDILQGGYHDAILEIESRLADAGVSSLSELGAIGHRVVHGGEVFTQSVLIDAEVIETIRGLSPLAPLHNPANLEGILISRAHAPEVPQVAVFDTAFHQSIPDYAYRYALPEEVYTQKGVRRYGFHGTSHHFVAKEAAATLGKRLSDTNLITLHLGNGASACAVAGGVSVDTSMGFTPLEGLVMGSRSGDLDPAILFYLAREHGYSITQLDTMLNKESGLLGLCGEYDMRRIHQRIAEGDADAKLAHDIFCYRIRKYIGAYVAVLGHVDAIVFTGGIGENDSITRNAIMRDLPFDIRPMTIATDEELEIAMQTMGLVG
jgi:acetate kinase